MAPGKTKSKQIEQKEDGSISPGEIVYKYVKTPTYRMYEVGGVHGGVTANGRIFMHIFIEHAPVPEEETYSITHQGTLGDRVGSKTDKKILREIECGLSFDQSTLKSIRGWIDEKLEILEKAQTNKD